MLNVLIAIPDFGTLTLAAIIVCDYNGTLAVDGVLLLVG
jgi:hypothetical protein